MSFFQGNFISRPFESRDAIPEEDRLTYNPPPNWRPASRDSSDGFSSSSGRSDGFDRSSSINDDGSSSRESSPGLEVVYNPDLSYRKQAAFQSREASGAPSAGQPDINNTSSTPSSHPISDAFSPDDDEVDDELWDELMGMSGNEADEPQSSNDASAADPGNPQPDDDEEEDELLAMMTKSLEKELAETQSAEQPPAEEEEDDPMLAMMTASLEEELSETQAAEQPAAETEEAASARKKALLEEQLRVAAEKAALAAQFDSLHEPAERRPGATASPRAARRRAGLKGKVGGVDQGLVFKDSPKALDRHARRMAAAKKASRARLEDVVAKAIAETPAARDSSACVPSTASTPVRSRTAAPMQSMPAAPMQSMPAAPIQNMPAAPMQSTPAAPLRSLPVPPRRYHLADILDWGLLTGRMNLSKSRASCCPLSGS